MYNPRTQVRSLIQLFFEGFGTSFYSRNPKLLCCSFEVPLLVSAFGEAATLMVAQVSKEKN